MARVNAAVLKRKLRGEFELLQKKFRDTMAKTVGAKINDTIAQGRTPVKGGASRFQEYSASYKRQIEENDGVIRGTDGRLNTGKRVRPVNLFVSGDMLKSQKVEKTPKGVAVSYSKRVDGKNIAAVHNNGDPSRNLPARRILPTKRGEEFSREVKNHITGTAKKLVIRTVQKINRG